MFTTGFGDWSWLHFQINSGVTCPKVRQLGCGGARSECRRLTPGLPAPVCLGTTLGIVVACLPSARPWAELWVSSVSGTEPPPVWNRGAGSGAGPSSGAAGGWLTVTQLHLGNRRKRLPCCGHACLPPAPSTREPLRPWAPSVAVHPHPLQVTQCRR